MRIGFDSEELQKVFNRREKLEAAYGPRLARSIRIRMAVLRSANHLGLVPQLPPIGLAVIDPRSLTFSVDLVEKRALLFRSSSSLSSDLELSYIREISILAVQ